MSIQSSAPSISKQPTDLVISIRESEEKETLVSRKSSISPPTNHSQVAEIIKLAKEAVIAGNQELLHEYDVALASFYGNVENLQNVFNLHAFRTDLSVFQLNLPITKNHIITEINKVSMPPFSIENDEDSLFSDVIRERLSDNVLNRIRDRIVIIPASQEKMKELAQYILKEDSGQKILQEMNVSQQFFFLLYLLKAPEYHAALLTAFTALEYSIIEDENFADQYGNDFVHLVLKHVNLKRFLAKDNDHVEILVKDSTTGKEVSISASRLLLAVGSRYFQSLLTKNAQDTNDQKVKLTETAFNKEDIEFLLAWLQYPQFASFSSKVDSFSHVERFLTHVAGFALRNENAFLERIQMELVDNLEDQNLQDTLKLALKFNLKLTISGCIHFINQHPSKSVHIRPEKNGKLEISNLRPNIPVALANAIETIDKKIDSVTLSILPVEPSRIALLRDKISGLILECEFGPGDHVRMRRRSICLLQTLWRVVKRAGICYLSIFAIQKALEQPPLPVWETCVISLSVGLSYPAIKAIAINCIYNPLRRRCLESRIVYLPTLAAYRSFANCFASSKNNLQCCYQPPSLSPILLKAIPNNISTLDLTSSKNLTDEDLEHLVQNHPDIKQIVLGFHPRISARGYSFLERLTQLQHVAIYLLGENHTTRSLMHFNLANIAKGRNKFRIDLNIRENVISLYPLNFLRNLPKNVEVRIQIHHQPGSTLFNSEINQDQILGRLSNDCNSVTHLDVGHSFYIYNFNTIAQRFPELRSLKVLCPNHDIIVPSESFPKLEELQITYGIQSPNVMAGIVQCCPQLRKISLQGTAITNEGFLHLANAKNLKSCIINGSHTINEACIQVLLNLNPPLEELVVRRSDLISEKTMFLIGERMKGLNKDEFLKISNEIREVNPLPLEQIRLITPVIFQLILDNFGVQIRKIHKYLPFLKSLQEALEVEKHPNLKIRSSIIESLGQIPYMELWNGFKTIRDFMDSFERGDSINIFEHVLKSIGPEWMPIVSIKYKEFLSDTFSDSYVGKVDELVQVFFSQLKDDAYKIREHLSKFILAFRVELREDAEALSWATENAPWMKHCLDFVQSINAAAKENGWSNEQKGAAILSAVFSDHTWFIEYLFPNRPEVQVYKDDEKKDER